jgi:hypothetical protein
VATLEGLITSCAIVISEGRRLLVATQQLAADEAAQAAEASKQAGLAAAAAAEAEMLAAAQEAERAMVEEAARMEAEIQAAAAQSSEAGTDKGGGPAGAGVVPCDLLLRGRGCAALCGEIAAAAPPAAGLPYPRAARSAWHTRVWQAWYVGAIALAWDCDVRWKHIAG